MAGNEARPIAFAEVLTIHLTRGGASSSFALCPTHVLFVEWQSCLAYNDQGRRVTKTDALPCESARDVDRHYRIDNSQRARSSKNKARRSSWLISLRWISRVSEITAFCSSAARLAHRFNAAGTARNNTSVAQPQTQLRVAPPSFQVSFYLRTGA